MFGIIAFAFPAQAVEEPQCFCSDDIKQITIRNYQNAEDTVLRSGCRAQTTVDQSAPQKWCDVSVIVKPSGNKYDSCDELYATPSLCAARSQQWEQQRAARLQAMAELGGGVKSDTNAVPPCLKQDTLTSNCRDIGVFIYLFINWGKSSFAIIGSFALAYFIYGGFILILSQGNPEKIKQGTDTMLAALIGLFIMFAAYMLIRFLGTAVGLQEQFILRP